MIEKLIDKTNTGELKWERRFPKGYATKTKNAIIILFDDELIIKIGGEYGTQKLDSISAQTLLFAIKDQIDEPKTLWKQIEW